MICQVNEALSDNEQELLVRGIAKFLANGKSKIIVELEAKIPAPAVEKIEKALTPERDLAKKLGGEIRFVRSGGTESEAALRDLGGGSSPADHALLKAQAEIERLKMDNRLLMDKIEELMAKVSEPSSDTELRAAVDHYRKLSEEIEDKKVEDKKADAKKP